MDRVYIVLVLSLMLVNKSLGQIRTLEKKRLLKDDISEEFKKPKQLYEFISKEGVSALLNKSFHSLLSYNTNGNLIGNYASIDPLNGTAAFNGSIDMNKERSNNARISVLNFKIKGGILSDNSIELFRNSTINKNSSIDIEYHFKTSNKFKYSYSGVDEVNINLKKQIINQKYNIAQLAYQREFDNNGIRRDIINSKMKYHALLLDSLNAKLRYYDLSFNMTPNTNLLQKKILGDSLEKVYDQITKLTSLIKDLELRADSINAVINNAVAFEVVELEKVENKKKSMLDTLESKISLLGYKFGWITFIGGFNRKDFYIFKPDSSFSKQLNQREINTLRVGLAYNFYQANLYKNKGLLVNTGFIIQNDNNIELLTSTEVSEEKVIKNALGDTTRKVLNKYLTYPDSVKQGISLKAYANIYVANLKNGSSLHLFPSIYLYKYDPTSINLGIGYVFSFKNYKKDQPILNAEGFVQFNDIANRYKTNLNMLNRSNIGIRLSVPFNFK